MNRPIWVGFVALLAMIMVILLAVASANTSFFDQYFAWLYAANIVIAIAFIFVILGLITQIIVRLKTGRFGARLIAKLAMFFALVGVLPGAILYGVSLQFVSRSIESWFDVKVEGALEAGLNLGRTSIEVIKGDLVQKAKNLASQIGSSSSGRGEGGLTLLLSRQREQLNFDEIFLFTSNKKVIASASLGLNNSLDEIFQDDKIKQASSLGSYIQVEEPDLATNKSNYSIKILLPVDGISTQAQLSTFNIKQTDERYLLVVKEIPKSLSQDALAVQEAYREYQEKALGRVGLRKMYIGTLTITLFLALFIAVVLALMLGRQLAHPLLMLLKGTQQVAEGDLSPKPEIDTGDELGLLTRQFNVMTRQLLEARTSLQESKAFSESVLSNLTAGVCVLDKDFKLLVSNPGASRIFGVSLDNYVSQSLGAITKLVGFDRAIQEAFKSHEIARQSEHWQKQILLDDEQAIDPQHENGFTLLVRGTRLPSGAHIVVFDDISEVITAQRTKAWGEVARRLAHEIKNPLTPIQLSAERLQLKLEPLLTDQSKELLQRSTTTIIGQVEAMKKMVNDFRDFAKTPEPQFELVDLNSLIEEILGLYEANKVKVKLDLACPRVVADPTQLRQVIHNLVQNALDASAEAHHKDTYEVLVQTEFLPFKNNTNEQEGIVKLSVMDDGTGFAQRVLNRAFEPYVTTKEKGTGLGLAMVKKIIDEHHARIELRNRLKDSEVLGAEVSIYFNQLVKSS